MSNNETNVKLMKGLRGRVVKLDRDGDVLIKFDGIEINEWVLEDQFDKFDEDLVRVLSSGRLMKDFGIQNWAEQAAARRRERALI